MRLGTQFASILEPGWLPECKKIDQNGGARRIDFCIDFSIGFCAIWVPAWAPSWAHVGLFCPTRRTQKPLKKHQKIIQHLAGKVPLRFWSDVCKNVVSSLFVNKMSHFFQVLQGYNRRTSGKKLSALSPIERAL